MPDSRTTFHQQLDDVQRDLIRAAARVTEAIMRGTEALLARARLEGVPSGGGVG